MKILNLSLKNFRNILEQEFEFSDGVNLIYGKNAQGKTNITEAIWMFTGARSFRGSKDIDLVNFSESFARIDGDFWFENREHEISILFSGGKRKAIMDGITKPYPTNIIGRFRAVIFSPIHLSLIKSGPDFRRRFLDAAVCQLKPTYTSLISRYNQILKQRNCFLKNLGGQTPDDGLLDIWNDKISEIGALIIKNRLEYLEILKKHAYKIFNEISGGNDELILNYNSSISKNLDFSTPVKEIEENFRNKLQKLKSSELKCGSTLCGAHKDDLDVIINGYPARNFASQGQQRSAALTFKLSEAIVLEEVTGESPVILLDDVMSELDPFRKEYLINNMGGRQVFITACDLSDLASAKKGRAFGINAGKIFEIKDF